MILSAKYVHTNLVAADWKRLAAFYTEVFGCIPVPPERDFQGKLLEAGTNLPEAHLIGMHLRLPGWGEAGPTLEIFNYSPAMDALNPAVNRPGFGHIAFQVEDVQQACSEVVKAGGRAFGEVVTLAIATGAKVTWCYLADPEGNLIEVQSWSK